MKLFDFFRRKESIVPVEERKVNLGGLMFNSISNFSQTEAMKLSAVYCATNQISNSVAMLPINIIQYDSQESKQIEHPLWKILNLCPDNKYNHFNVFKMAVESVILKGNAYFYIERDMNLNVKAIRYINEQFVQPMLQEDGTVKYLVNGIQGAVDAVNMIHLWQHVDINFKGLSLLRYAYNSLNGAHDAEKAASKFFRGGAGLNGVLKASSTLTNEQKGQIRDSWNAAFGNDGNGIAVLPQGLDFQAVSISPEDSQLLQSRQFNITEIARYFNISPIKLYQLQEVSYSSMESTQLSYLSDTIMPYVQMFEEEFNRKLFKPSEIGKLGVKFDFKKAMNTNKEAEANYYRSMLTNGIMSLNEIRGQLGMSKLDNESGDAHFIQISYGNAEDVATGKYIKQNAQQQSTNTDNKI